MTNKTTIIILVVVLVLALGFLTFSVYFYMSRQGQVEVVEQPTSTRPATGGSTGTPSAPLQTSVNYSQVFGEARLAMDPERCGALPTSDEVRDCADKINLLIAYRDRDMNSCRGIYDAMLRDSCYVNIGNQLGKSYCKYLSDQELKASCEADESIQ